MSSTHDDLPDDEQELKRLYDRTLRLHHMRAEYAQELDRINRKLLAIQGGQR